jgi:hypothetical protein
VYWDGGSLVQRASGLAEKRITLREITDIRTERAPITDIFAMGRPFRRIAVYGRKSDSAAFIDVSLRHFQIEDIRELLSAIHVTGPDKTGPAAE